MFKHIILFLMPMFFSMYAYAIEKPSDSAAWKVYQPSSPDIHIEHLRDPFVSYLRTSQQKAAKVSRETHRPQDALEVFELSTLTLVGVFSTGSKRVAMIEDNTGKGHMVRVGDYMGKRNGKVQRISNHALFLIEKTLNPAGDVVDKHITMTLNEVSQP